MELGGGPGLRAGMRWEDWEMEWALGNIIPARGAVKLAGWSLACCEGHGLHLSSVSLLRLGEWPRSSGDGELGVRPVR